MNNISNKKGWKLGMAQENVEPLPITLITGTCDGKSDKYFVKLKLRRYPTRWVAGWLRSNMSITPTVSISEYIMS